MIDHVKIDPALLSWMDGMHLQAYQRPKTEPNIRMQPRAGKSATDIVQAVASFGWLSSQNPGWDDVRQDENAVDPQLLDQVVTGPRILTASIRVVSILMNAPGHAFALAGRLRTRLRLPSVSTILKTAGIAFAEMTDIIDISEKERNGRWRGICVFDVRFNAAAAETDPTTDTIGTVEVTSNYIGEDGNPLPAANQLTEFPIPVDP